jgi:hypothetical protein
MQKEIQTAEPLVPGPSHLEVEISIAKLKKYKSPGSDQILAELIKAGGETLVSVIHKLITSIWNKEEMSDQWKESIIVPIHKKGDTTIPRNSVLSRPNLWLQYSFLLHMQQIPCSLLLLAPSVSKLPFATIHLLPWLPSYTVLFITPQFGYCTPCHRKNMRTAVMWLSHHWQIGIGAEMLQHYLTNRLEGLGKTTEESVRKVGL